jgi:16S rRNA (uracil1498-N3)-methyltransferase
MRRLPLSDLQEGPRALDAPSSRYVGRVLRARVGEVFEVFDPRSGHVAHASVESIADVVNVYIRDVRREIPESPLILVQGYPKGDKLADIVRDATELGATMVIPAICTRSVARPDEKKSAAKVDRLMHVAAEAARQSGRSRAPEIAPPMSWSDALDVARAHTTYRYVLWEKASERLVIHPSREGTSFVIGPEGGLTDEEVASAHGFTICSLGKTILRTETAATAVLGAFRVLAP